MAEDPEDPEQRLQVLGRLSDERPADPVAFHLVHPLRRPALEERHEVVLVGENGELEELLEVHVLVKRRRGVVPVEHADDGLHGLRVVVGKIDGPFHAVFSRGLRARAVESESESWRSARHDCRVQVKADRVWLFVLSPIVAGPVGALLLTHNEHHVAVRVERYHGRRNPEM